MEKFKRKPKSKTEFFDSMDDLNDTNDISEIRKRAGRPSLPNEIKTKKTSISIRRSDEMIIDEVIDKLVGRGFKKPFPTSSEIHRMALMALANLSDDDLVNYYNDSKL